MTSSLSIAGILLAGFLLGSLPAALFALQRMLAAHVGVEAERFERWLHRGLFLPSIFFLPAAGWLVDQLGANGAKDAALLGLLILAVGVAILGLVPAPKSARTTLVALSLGLSLFAVGVLAWTPEALGMAHRAIEALNLGFVTIGVGWLLGGWLATRAERWVGLRNTLVIGAGFSLILFATLIGIPLEPRESGPAIELSLDARFWLLGAMLVLYFPIESCVDVWSGPFLRELTDSNPARIHRRLVAFWVAYLGARLCAVWFVPHLGYERAPWLLLACSLVSAMVVGNLVGAHESSSGTFGFWLLGFCYGPLLPGFLGMLCDRFPGQHGVILGGMLAIGSFYHAALDPFLNRYLERHSARAAMRLPMFLMLALSAPLLLYILLGRAPA